MAKRKDLHLSKLVKSVGKAVEKRFKGHIVAGQASEVLKDVNAWVSTGSLALDRICVGKNPGGLPVGPHGRIVHLAGDWSTGKSVVLDHLFKSVQDMGGLALCSETEGSRDFHFLRAMGANLDMLTIHRPMTIEQLFDAGLEWHEKIRSEPECKDIPIIWGIDTLDSTEADKSARTDMTQGGGWKYGGGKSEALGEALRRVANRVCARYPTTLVMLNQTRAIVGMPFGPKKRTPGGNPPHFYSTMEIWLYRSPMGDVRGKYRGAKLTPEQRKRFGLGPERGDIIGRWVRAKIHKTKVSRTLGMECDFYIDFSSGISLWAGMLQRMLSEGMVTLSAPGTMSMQVDGQEISFTDEVGWVRWMMAHPEHWYG